LPCGRELNNGALSLSEARPSANTNIASIRTYCTRPETESGNVWRKLDFGTLNMALSYYVQVAATALCPRYAELVEANPNMARMVRWEVWDMPLKEIVPDATVLEWIAKRFPELNQDTASVGDAIHASQSSLSRQGAASRGEPTKTAVMEIHVRRGEYSIHSRRLGNLAAPRSAGPSSQRACLQDPGIWSSRCSLCPTTDSSFPAKPRSWITRTVTMLPR
jgi:hypothetical protein